MGPDKGLLLARAVIVESELAVQFPAEAGARAACLGSDHADAFAGLALIPQESDGALERAVTAPAINRLVATVIEIYVLVRKRAANAAGCNRLGFFLRTHDRALQVSQRWSGPERAYWRFLNHSGRSTSWSAAGQRRQLNSRDADCPSAAPRVRTHSQRAPLLMTEPNEIYGW